MHLQATKGHRRSAVVRVRLALGASAMLLGCASAVGSNRDGGDSSRADAIDAPSAADVRADSCRTAGDCTGGRACVFETPGCGVASMPGRCALPTPCAEPSVFCACDGTTFVACEAGQPFTHLGACEGPDGGVTVGCSPGTACPGGNECRFPPGCGLLRGACMPITDCAATRPFCGCDNTTFLDCPGSFASRPYQSVGPCGSTDAGTTTRACRAPGDCALGEECIFTAGCPRDTPAMGTCGAPMECFVAVAFCGCNGTTFQDCPSTPSQSFSHRGACDTPPPPVDCDPSSVICRSLPPVCAAGDVPSVIAGCWGPCVNAATCAPMPCATGRACPPGWRCDSSSGFCAY